MKRIKHQEEESKVYGLKIGRSGRIDSFQLDELSQEIMDGEYDVCRLKLSLGDATVFDKLDKLGFYYSPYTVMSRTVLKLTDAHGSISIPDDMSFELYNGSQSEEIERLIREGFSVATSVSYNSPLYSSIFPDSSFMDSSIKYFLSFNHSVNPEKIMYLFRYKERYIGCYCLDLSEEEVDTPLGIMLPEFRNTGQTQLMMQHATQTAYNFNHKTLGSDASLLNLPSVRAQLSYGMKLNNSYLNVVVFPLLSKSITVLEDNSTAVVSDCQIFNSIVNHLSTSGISNFCDVTFKTGLYHLLSKNNTTEILISEIFRTGENFFIAGKQVENGSNKTLQSFYMKGIVK